MTRLERASAYVYVYIYTYIVGTVWTTCWLFWGQSPGHSNGKRTHEEA